MTLLIFESLLSKLLPVFHTRILLWRFTFASNNFLALILYGSWAKKRAREDSDIDLLAIFKSVDKNVTRSICFLFHSFKASSFKQLFSFYIKAEYELESPDKDDVSQAIKDANKIIKVIEEMMQDIF